MRSSTIVLALVIDTAMNTVILLQEVVEADTVAVPRSVSVRNVGAIVITVVIVVGSENGRGKGHKGGSDETDGASSHSERLDCYIYISLKGRRGI